MTELKTKRFFTCPNGCDHEFEVEHLFKMRGSFPGSAGPWYCDKCGDSWNISYTADSVEVTRSNRPRQIKTHVVLEIPVLKSPIRFRTTRDVSPDTTNENLEFSYESHSCPTNWLREIDTMEFEGDQDPHGVIQFVNSFPATSKTLDSSNSQRASLFTVPDISTGEWR